MSKLLKPDFILSQVKIGDLELHLSQPPEALRTEDKARTFQVRESHRRPTHGCTIAMASEKRGTYRIDPYSPCPKHRKKTLPIEF